MRGSYVNRSRKSNKAARGNDKEMKVISDNGATAHMQYRGVYFFASKGQKNPAFDGATDDISQAARRDYFHYSGKSTDPVENAKAAIDGVYETVEKNRAQRKK